MDMGTAKVLLLVAELAITILHVALFILGL